MSKNITITVIDRQDKRHKLQIPVDMQLNLMEVCKAEGLGVLGTCGGMALCSTCHLYIESDHEFEVPSMEEEGMLDQAFYVDDEKSRLGCQLPITEAMDGLIVKLAPQGM